MLINKFCFCCNKESQFYKNKNTSKVSTYCSECNSKYSPKERELRTILNFQKIINPIIKE